MKIFSNKKTIINLIIIILIVTASIHFGIWPLCKKSTSLYKENKDKTAKLNKLQEEINYLKDLETSLKKDKSKISKTLNYLPKKDTTNFVTQTEALAVNTGNILKSVKFKESKQPLVSVANTKEKAFDIIIGGNFNSIQSFLSGLEKLTQFNNVYNIAIDVSDEGVLSTLTGAIYTRED